MAEATMESDAVRWTYCALATVGALATGGFILAILAIGGSAYWLHEVAGVVVLVLLVAAIVLAAAMRTKSPILLGRAALALGLLIATGTVGAALGLHTLPTAYNVLPLLLLIALLAAQAEMIRVSRSSQSAG